MRTSRNQLKNYCIRYLSAHKQTTKDWEYLCMDLSDVVSTWLEKKGIRITDRLWLEPPKTSDDTLRPITYSWMEWRYHVVILDDKGRVHDAWCPRVLKLSAYLNFMFPNQKVSVEAFKKISEREE